MKLRNSQNIKPLLFFITPKAIQYWSELAVEIFCDIQAYTRKCGVWIWLPNLPYFSSLYASDNKSYYHSLVQLIGPIFFSVNIHPHYYQQDRLRTAKVLWSLKCWQQNCSTWFVGSGCGLLFLYFLTSNLFFLSIFQDHSASMLI